MCILQIFSPILWLVFSFSWLSFAGQKFLILIKSILSVLFFMDRGFVSTKSLQNTSSSRFSPMLSSRSFIVLCFTVRSVNHFELIFVKGKKSVSRFMFLLMEVHLFHYHLLKRLSLLYCIAFATLSKVNWLYLCRSTSGLSVLFHWSIC